jgi:hypothetical protein
MRRKLYQLGRFLTLQTKTTCMEQLRSRQNHLRFISRLLEDVIASILITAIIYFVALVFLYAQITSNRLADPSQLLNLDAKCDNMKLVSSNESDVFNDMSILSTFIVNTLDKLDQKYFICYRTLYELLRLADRNKNQRHSMDICVYDSHSNLVSVIENIADLLGYSDLERSLSKSKLFKYKFDRLFGRVEVEYHTASANLYFFNQVPPNRMNFEGIRRSGIIYTQFEFLIEHFKTLSRLTGLVYFNNNNRNILVNVLNRLPLHILEGEGVEYKVKVGQSYFPLPIEPYDALMYFYPESWWKHIDNCTV